MNLSGFENTLDLANEISEGTEGEVVSNQLGTNNVAEPIDDNDHIAQFNRGVEAMTQIGNYNIGITESKNK